MWSSTGGLVLTGNKGSTVATCTFPRRKAGRRRLHIANLEIQATHHAVDTRSKEARQQLFNSLSINADVRSLVQLSSAAHGEGIFAAQNVTKGEVLLSVPRRSCIVIDYAQGMTIDQGRADSWPRLKEGLSREEPLPWDLLLSLALVDARTGRGSTFWEEYASVLLPEPQDLTLPNCWGPDLLKELQHDDIVQGALQQQARLAGLFPDLSEPLGPGMPSIIQWGLACVRSRAFRLGEEAFAFVPFMDFANHAADPNSDFSTAANGAVELTALRDIEAGEEVCISYTGPAGFTNQRLMAQYGFVPAGGNPADRFIFPIRRESWEVLSLSSIEERMGDEALMDIATGKRPYLFAALKSLPFADVPRESEDDEMGLQMRLVGNLLRECTDLLSGFQTTAEQDKEILRGLQQPQDAKLAAAVRYRYERKQLLMHAQSLVWLYIAKKRDDID